MFARNLQLQQLVGQLEAKLAELQAKPAVQQLLAQPAIATKLKVVELKATIDEHDAQRERRVCTHCHGAWQHGARGPAKNECGC